MNGLTAHFPFLTFVLALNHSLVSPGVQFLSSYCYYLNIEKSNYFLAAREGELVPLEWKPGFGEA
jgi:hypothetical protein